MAAVRQTLHNQLRIKALFESFLDSTRCVISVMGTHAGECADAIYRRIIADIERSGSTFWLMKSPKAKPIQVHELCKQNEVHAIFIDPATKGGARPTATDAAAREYSIDKQIWYRLADSLSPVTGKLDSQAAALIFDEMTTSVEGAINLWDYADFSDPQMPVRFKLGCSTICALKKDMTAHSRRMKSRYRGIVAVARLARAYCAWLR